MSEIRCIIVDDEPIARRGMRRLVGSRGELELVAELDSAEAAAEWLESKGADLIFLDIRMRGASGVELASWVPPDCMVIFTTAYSDYALESYDVEALDYLVKPIDPVRFDRAVDKAVTYLDILRKARSADAAPAPETDFIIVKADRRYVRVRTADILYVEGLKDYVIIHLADRRVVTRLTVRAMEEMLPRAAFLRVNKSYIVSLDRIDSFDGNDIYINDTPIAIGVSYKESVMSALLGPGNSR